MFVEVNGIHLYYEVSGSGPAMILLHGNGETHEIFDRCIPELQKEYTVYAVDSRCHGLSSDTKMISYSLMAEDIIAMIKALHLHRPILYGFSDGGIVGLLIAIREKQLLSSLIISGANISPGGLKSAVLFLCWTHYLFTGNRLYRLMVREPNIGCDELQRICIPVTVLAGEKDMIKTSHTRMIARKIPDSTLVIIPHETHGSYVVHSDKLYGILKKYIRRDLETMHGKEECHISYKG